MKKLYSILLLTTLLFASCGDATEEDGYDDPLEPSGVEMEEEDDDIDTTYYDN